MAPDVKFSHTLFFLVLQCCTKALFYEVNRLVFWGCSYEGELARLDGLPRLGEMTFFPTFIWNLQSWFNQKVCHAAEKRLFDRVIFTIKSDVKPSCRANIPTLFDQHLKNKTKLIKENSIPPCRAGSLARICLENFHLA